MVFKKPISISFAPNFQQDDVLLAVRLLCGRIPLSTQSTATTELKRAIGNLFQDTNVSLFSSGRSALYYGLKALGLSEGDEVLVQAFTCVAVPNAVIWNGLQPVFVDIDHSYNFDVVDLERKITPRTKAIIVQHTFGIPANMSLIQKLAKKHHLYIVEDCAHALGGMYQNRLLGTFGDVSILSFGRDKVVSSVFGGAAISSDKKIASSLTTYEKNLEPSPWFYSFQQLFYLITYAISLPLYNLFIGKLLLRTSRWIGLLSQAVYKKEWGGQMPFFTHYAFPSKLAVLAIHQLHKLPLFREHRTKISTLYVRHLDLQLEPAPYLRIPYIVENKHSFLKKAQGVGLHLGNWYRGAVDPTGTDLEHLGYLPCPTAEHLAKHTINLPTHINISAKDAEEIVTFIKSQKSL